MQDTTHIEPRAEGRPQRGRFWGAALLGAKQASEPGQGAPDSLSVSALERWVCTPWCVFTQVTSWLRPHGAWGALPCCWALLGAAGRSQDLVSHLQMLIHSLQPCRILGGGFPGPQLPSAHDQGGG